MYNIEPQKYFQNIFNFLRTEDDNRIDLKKLFYYIFLVLAIVIFGQIIVNNSDSYKSDNIANEKFIKTEFKGQSIIDTITLPIKQTYFKSYSAIKLKDGSVYRLNLVSRKNEHKITKNAILEKEANDKAFEIVNNNIRYKFEVSELNNFEERIFVFFISIILSVVGIPLWLKKNKLEKEYKKTAINS